MAWGTQFKLLTNYLLATSAVKPLFCKKQKGEFNHKRKKYCKNL